MMSRAVLSLVLLVSTAHALVHVYEIALPSVEQSIASEYYGADAASGKRFTGFLSNAWRLMWGLGALVAGWLVDRYGGRLMLAIYLLGCATACGVAASVSSEPQLLLAMVLMGALASIYHPAGLALISHETTPANRPRALGIHGIFGSAGIGLTPLLAASMLGSGFGWRQIYWLLAVPGGLLGLFFCWQALRHIQQQSSKPANALPQDDDRPDWQSFFTLTVMAAMQGFIYSALMAYLPRYLGSDSAPSVPESANGGAEVMGNYLASAALLLGCLGQYLAGRFARPSLLELQMTLVLFGNAPLLMWMAVAASWDRTVSAGLLALVHFMHQPIYNSLIAKYTPRRRRSLCYGFSFAMGLGLGSFGAGFAGSSQSDFFVYGTLSAIALVAGVLGLLLWKLNRRPPPELQLQ